MWFKQICLFYRIVSQCEIAQNNDPYVVFYVGNMFVHSSSDLQEEA